MQTGSSGTLIGWKSGQTTFVPLWDRMEGAWLRPRRNIGNLTSQSTEYTELQPLLSGIHSVMRVKFALAGKGGGCTPTPHPLLLHLPSPVKLQCTLQLSGQTPEPCFNSRKICTLCLSLSLNYLYSTVQDIICRWGGGGEGWGHGWGS
jgi:hypothetical protein